MKFVLTALLLTTPVLALADSSRDFIKSSSDDKKIEFFLAKPEGKGPFPALLLIHPEQESPKNGGESFVKYGQLDHWAKKGFVAVAISQPGYGLTEGAADFCGPKTQSVALDLIKYLQTLPEVDPNHIFIYGGSRGAVVASMVATMGIPLAGVILKSGVYDFIAWSQQRSWYDGIKLQMFWEMGWLSEEKLKSRSAYYFADKIKSPILLIHGAQDDRAPILLVEKFYNKILESGGKAQLVPIQSGHVIPMPEINTMMEEFLRKNL